LGKKQRGKNKGAWEELKWKKNDQGTEGYGFGKVEIGLQQKEVKNLANDKKKSKVNFWLPNLGNVFILTF
jgi:hypothetical protein